MSADLIQDGPDGPGDGLELRLMAIEGRLAKLEGWADMFAQHLQAVYTLEQRWPTLKQEVIASLKWEMKQIVASRLDDEIDKHVTRIVSKEIGKAFKRASDTWIS